MVEGKAGRNEPTIAELKKQIKRKDEEIARLKQRSPIVIGEGIKGGYLVLTPDPAFTGTGGGGVRFVSGKAFLGKPQTEEEEKEQNSLLRIMRSDFHYTVRELDEEGVEELRQAIPDLDASEHSKQLHNILQPQPIGS